MEENPKPRILIVESYGGNLKSLSGQLTALPFAHETLGATDGEAALAMLQNDNVDLVIIDTLLSSRMDGYELCRALRSSPAHRTVSVILLLAGHLSLERLKGMQSGADLLLHRPIVKEELLNMVQLLLGLKGQMTQQVRSDSTVKPRERRLHSV